MAALAGGEPVTVEFRVRRPDGELRLLQARARLLPEGDGRPARVLGTSHDVTERHDARRVLQEREEHVARLERLAGTGSWEMDMDTGRITWSREQLRIHGLPLDQPDRTEADFLALVHPDDRARVVDVMTRLVAAGEPFHVEYRIVRPDGEVRQLEAPGQLVPGPDGRLTRMIGMSRDVTERHATELGAARLGGELPPHLPARLRRALAARRADRRDPRRERRRVRDARLPGRRGQGARRGGLSAGVAPYTLETRARYIERAAAGEPQQFEWLGRRRDGGDVWLDMRLRRVRIGADDRILATARDIGARKAAEDALREANEALERRVASAPPPSRSPTTRCRSARSTSAA
jgi:PAS domain S-box-containing protein